MNRCVPARVKKRQQYVRNACNQCKRRKVKCSGESHCQQCVNHGVLCTYNRVATSPQSSSSSSEASSRYEGLQDRILQLQASLSQVLKHMKGSHKDHDTPGTELDALLMQAATIASECRLTSSGGNSALPISESRQQEPRSHSVPVTTEKSPILNTAKVQFTVPLSKEEALELIEEFRFEAECFYPFIPFDSMISLAMIVLDDASTHSDLTTSTETESWEHIRDDRNTELLRVLLACAAASRAKKETEVSRQLVASSMEKIGMKVGGAVLNPKEIAISALVCIYHLHCDDILLAWRWISDAARMCQELELHTSLVEQPSWILRMFWCIYVLDKRLSFMLRLPFILHDADIKHQIPEDDESLLYVTPIVKYLRIAARIVPIMPKYGDTSENLDPTTCVSIETDTDQWALSTSIDNIIRTNQGPNFKYGISNRDQFNSTLVIVCQNLLKLSLYKHNLYSLDCIVRNLDLSNKAVTVASETIQSCKNLQQATQMYQLQAVHFNFFVLSAVTALYLAVRHAPVEFSKTSQDIFVGLEILRPYCASSRLGERVQALDNAMKRLGFDPYGLGPQLFGREMPFIQEIANTPESQWSEKTEASAPLMLLTPNSGRSASFASFISTPQTANFYNDIEWINTRNAATAHEQPDWNNQEWIL